MCALPLLLLALVGVAVPVAGVPFPGWYTCNSTAATALTPLSWHDPAAWDNGQIPVANVTNPPNVWIGGNCSLLLDSGFALSMHHFVVSGGNNTLATVPGAAAVATLTANFNANGQNATFYISDSFVVDNVVLVTGNPAATILVPGPNPVDAGTNTVAISFLNGAELQIVNAQSPPAVLGGCQLANAAPCATFEFLGSATRLLLKDSAVSIGTGAGFWNADDDLDPRGRGSIVIVNDALRPVTVTSGVAFQRTRYASFVNISVSTSATTLVLLPTLFNTADNPLLFPVTVWLGTIGVQYDAAVAFAGASLGVQIIGPAQTVLHPGVSTSTGAVLDVRRLGLSNSTTVPGAGFELVVSLKRITMPTELVFVATVEPVLRPFTSLKLDSSTLATPGVLQVGRLRLAESTTNGITTGFQPAGADQPVVSIWLDSGAELLITPLPGLPVNIKPWALNFNDNGGVPEIVSIVRSTAPGYGSVALNGDVRGIVGLPPLQWQPSHIIFDSVVVTVNGGGLTQQLYGNSNIELQRGARFVVSNATWVMQGASTCIAPVGSTNWTCRLDINGDFTQRDSAANVGKFDALSYTSLAVIPTNLSATQVVPSDLNIALMGGAFIVPRNVCTAITPADSSVANTWPAWRAALSVPLPVPSACAADEYLYSGCNAGGDTELTCRAGTAVAAAGTVTCTARECYAFCSNAPDIDIGVEEWAQYVQVGACYEYGGVACDTNCNGHGTCRRVVDKTGTPSAGCVCDSGYIGATCGLNLPGLIAGCVGGFVALVLGIALCLWFRKRYAHLHDPNHPDHPHSPLQPDPATTQPSTPAAAAAPSADRKEPPSGVADVPLTATGPSARA